MEQKKFNANLPLNKHPINTTRKILKLKKIKKRKISCTGAPLSNCDYGIKKMEDKIKKNEPNLGNNSFQNINKDKNQLLENINIFNNQSDNIIENINDNNINNRSNNTTLLDDNFSNNNGFLSLPIIVAIPVFYPPPNNFNFEFLNDNNNFPNSSFHNSLEIENQNNNNFSTTFFGGDNMNEFLVENPTNNASNISFYNRNNFNRNEINPQSNNTNNNNQNNNQINLRSNDSEFYFDYPRRRNRTNQNSNQINLRSNDSEFYFDYPRQRNGTNQNSNQINLRSNNSEFNLDYPSQRNRTNQNSNQINLRSNNSEFNLDYPSQRNRTNQINIPINLRSNNSEFNFDFPRQRNRNRNLTSIIKNIKNKLTRIRFRRSLSSYGNNESCIICMKDFRNNQNVYNLPCHHIFHILCLNKELKYRQKCPMCRNEL